MKTEIQKSFFFLKSYFSKKNPSESQVNKKLNKHLEFINQNSKYFKNLVIKNKIKNIYDLSSYPIMNKQIMMDNFDELNTQNLKKSELFKLALDSENSRDFSKNINKNKIDYSVGMSSGTSGNRGLFVLSPQEQAKWAGSILSKALPNFFFKKHRVALFLRSNNNLYQNINSKLIKFKFFDLINSLDTNLKAAQSYQPTVLVGPPSILHVLAENQNENFISLKPQRIFSSAEVLEDIDKNYIEQAFNQPVRQIYQCTEGFLGISCEHNTLHLNEDAVYFEKKFLDNSKTKFSPIITDFNRTTQPIIRYELNDILVLKKENNKIFKCPCGSQSTPIEIIEGRCDDIFQFDNKIIFPGLISRAIIRASDNISKYEAIQEDKNKIKIYLDIKSIQNKNQINQNIKTNFEILFKKLEIAQNKFPEITFSESFPRRDKLAKLKRIRNDMRH